MTELLRVQNVSKHYGGIYALKNASFSLAAGEVHALMGENGAGKSTMAKIIAGAVPPQSAEFVLDGRAVTIDSPLAAQALGIGIIFQELDLFPNLTVGENIVIGNLHFKEALPVSPAKIEAFCRPFLDQVGLSCSTRRLVATLPIGQMQLLTIARALSMNVRILFMDEPTSSLMDDAVDRLFALIAALKQRGVSIVYVSHKMDEIFRICDRITVLRDGETIGTRDIAATNIDEVIHMMVGRAVSLSERPHRQLPGEVCLRASNLVTRKLRDVSFELRRGEVLGVAGLVGAGRSELGAALFGLDRILSGSLTLNNTAFRPGSAADAIDAGVGLLPEDRKLEGLMMQMSVLENSTMAVLPRMQSFGFVHRAQENTAIEPIRKQLALKCASYRAPVSSLSGGNQQKALLARWLLVNPDVLFLDDPARGIDVGAKQDIYRIIDELAASGKGVLLVSSELPELLRCCDRILVLNDGRLTATFNAAEATQEKIMAAATTGMPQIA